MLKQACIKDSESINGIKILVARYFPRLKKNDGNPFTLENDFNFWFRELAPSNELLSKYSLSPDEREYREKYVKEILTNPEAITKLIKIWELSKNNDVYLLCYEPEGYFCHRYILLNILEDLSQVFERIKSCPYFMGEENKYRCALKYTHGKSFHYAPSRKRRRELVIWHKTIGDPEKCDFVFYRGLDSIKEFQLKDCVYYTAETKAYTCDSCYFYDQICLLREKKFCEKYVQKELKFGNFYIIYQIVQLSKAGIDLRKLIKNFHYGKELTETQKKIVETFLSKKVEEVA
jgi:uncharacterized protein YeaO (DUF488 family)